MTLSDKAERAYDQNPAPFDRLAGTLSEMEKARVHIVQLATASKFGQLEMKLVTAVNIVLREECPSLSPEDWQYLLLSTVAYLYSSSKIYDKHNIR